MTHSELETLLQTAEEDNKRGNFANAEKLAREAIEQLEQDKTSGNEATHIRALLALSVSLWQRGLAKEALPFAEQALNRSEVVNEPEIKELKAKAFNNMGVVNRQLSQYAKALEFYERALAIHEELGNRSGMARNLGNMANVYTELSQYTKAIEYFEQALVFEGEMGNKAGIASDAGNIGNVYRRLGQYGKALEYYEKALDLGKELGDKVIVANNTGNIGGVYSNLAEYTEALEYLEKALAIDEELGNKRGIATRSMTIAGVYKDLSQYAKSLEYYEKALVLSEAVDYKLGVTYATCNIGLVYQHLSQLTKALEYLEKSLALNEELDNKEGLAIITGNIGSVYADLSQYAKSLEYYQKALSLSEEIGLRRPAGYWLLNIGITLHELRRNKEAMEYLQRSLHLRRVETGSNEQVANTLISIGSLLAEDNQFAEAIDKFEEGLALAEKLGEKKEASEAHKELANLYAKQGDKAKAFDHFQAHYALDKEIFSDDTRRRVEAFNFRVATANKERDLKLARLEKEQAEQSLRMKERELANTASSLAAQMELLGNFRADLRKIVMRPDKYEPEAIIKQVREKLKELPCEMIDFGKFEAQFATVHPEFRAKLESKYPELTPQEIKICMLLHVNLQTAAIARLTCLSERTVENHRFNIRKKMGLERDDNLLEHLRKLDATTPQPPPTPSS